MGLAGMVAGTFMSGVMITQSETTRTLCVRR